MKVGIISDTHDHLEPMGKAVQIFREQKVEQIVHCGDWCAPYAVFHFGTLIADWDIPVSSVLGNNEGDYRRIFEKNASLKRPVTFAEVSVLELAIADKKAAVYHGHDVPTLNALIQSGTYQAVFTGHTHNVRNEYVGKTLVLNPGTLSYWSAGKVLDKATVAVYDSSNNTAEVITF